MSSAEQPPLSPETLDELLSADIDGALDRAADELGLTLESARAALAASPVARARRAALVQARDLLATPAALDPTDEARFVAAAIVRAGDHGTTLHPVARASTYRFRSARRALVGVATAAAVIAGVVALAAHSPTTDSQSSSATPNAAAATPPRPVPKSASRSFAFGAVDPPGAFHLRVRAALAHLGNQPLATPTGKVAQAPVPNSSAAASPDGVYRSNGGTTIQNAGADADAAVAKRRDCIDRLAATVPSAPVLSGSGTKGTQPVIVAVYRQGTSYLVYVMSAADCSVVSRTRLP